MCKVHYPSVGRVANPINKPTLRSLRLFANFSMPICWCYILEYQLKFAHTTRKLQNTTTCQSGPNGFGLGAGGRAWQRKKSCNVGKPPHLLWLTRPRGFYSRLSLPFLVAALRVLWLSAKFDYNDRGRMDLSLISTMCRAACGSTPIA